MYSVPVSTSANDQTYAGMEHIAYRGQIKETWSGIGLRFHHVSAPQKLLGAATSERTPFAVETLEYHDTNADDM